MACADQDPKALLDVSAEEDFQAQLQEADFGAATSALTILRYTCFPPNLINNHALAYIMSKIAC